MAERLLPSSSFESACQELPSLGRFSTLFEKQFGKKYTVLPPNLFHMGVAKTLIQEGQKFQNNRPDDALLSTRFGRRPLTNQAATAGEILCRFSPTLLERASNFRSDPSFAQEFMDEVMDANSKLFSFQKEIIGLNPDFDAVTFNQKLKQNPPVVIDPENIRTAYDESLQETGSELEQLIRNELDHSLFVLASCSWFCRSLFPSQLSDVTPVAKELLVARSEMFPQDAITLEQLIGLASLSLSDSRKLSKSIDNALTDETNKHVYRIVLQERTAIIEKIVTATFDTYLKTKDENIKADVDRIIKDNMDPQLLLFLHGNSYLQQLSFSEFYQEVEESIDEDSYDMIYVPCIFYGEKLIQFAKTGEKADDTFPRIYEEGLDHYKKTNYIYTSASAQSSTDDLAPRKENGTMILAVARYLFEDQLVRNRAHFTQKGVPVDSCSESSWFEWLNSKFDFAFASAFSIAESLEAYTK